MAIFLLVGAIIIGIILLSILRGFVLSYLWQWFVVPLGVPDITVVHAIGISMLVAFLTYENAYQGDSKEATTKLAGSVLAMPFILLIGYVIHSFM